MVKGQEKIKKQIKSQNDNIRNILHQTEKLNNINLGSLLDEICPNYESIRHLLLSDQHHHLRHNNDNDLTNIISNIPQKVKDFINETAIQTIFKDISEINTVADVKLKHKSDKKKLMNGSFPSIHANQWDYLGIKPESIYIQNEVAICVPATILTAISLLLSLEKKRLLSSPKKWIEKHLLSIPINLWRKFVSFQSMDLRLFHNMYLKDGMILQCHQEWESENNNKCSATPELHKIISNLNVHHHPQAFAIGIKADNWSHLILIVPGQCLCKNQFIGKYLCISTDISMETTKSKISKQIFLLDPRLDNKKLYGSDAFVDYLQTIGSEAEVDWIYSLYIDNNNNNNDNNSTKSDNFQELKVNNNDKNDNNNLIKNDNFQKLKDNFQELKDNFKPRHNVNDIVWNICYSDDGKKTAWLCKIKKQTAIPLGIIDENAGCFKKDAQWEEVIELFRKRKKKYIICCLVRYMGLTSKENEKLDFTIHDEWVEEDQLIKFEQNDLTQHGLKINYGEWIDNIKINDNNSNNNHNNNDNNNDNDDNNNNNDIKNIDNYSNNNNRKKNKKRKRYKLERSDDDDDEEYIYIENKQKKKKVHDW